MVDFLFSTALNLGPLEISTIIISSLGFLIMFGIASAKGDYQGIIDDALKNKNKSLK